MSCPVKWENHVNSINWEADSKENVFYLKILLELVCNAFVSNGCCSLLPLLNFSCDLCFRENPSVKNWEIILASCRMCWIWLYFSSKLTTSFLMQGKVFMKIGSWLQSACENWLGENWAEQSQCSHLLCLPRRLMGFQLGHKLGHWSHEIMNR